MTNLQRAARTRVHERPATQRKLNRKEEAPAPKAGALKGQLEAWQVAKAKAAACARESDGAMVAKKLGNDWQSDPAERRDASAK